MPADSQEFQFGVKDCIGEYRAEYLARNGATEIRMTSEAFENFRELAAICWVHRVRPSEVIRAVWRLHTSRKLNPPLDPALFVTPNAAKLAQNIAEDEKLNSITYELRVAAEFKQCYELYVLERNYHKDNLKALSVLVTKEKAEADILYRMSLLIGDYETAKLLEPEARWMLRVAPYRERVLFSGDTP